MSTKIKVFEFEVSNASSGCFSDDKASRWYLEGQNRLKSPAEIEVIVNKFIKDKEIINISINNVDSHYHNNGRSNTIFLVYTICYVDKEQQNISNDLKEDISDCSDTLTKTKVIDVLESMVHSRKTITGMNDFLQEKLGVAVDISDCTMPFKDCPLADYDFMGNIDAENIFCDFDIYVLPTREQNNEEGVYYITEVGYEFQ